MTLKFRPITKLKNALMDQSGSMTFFIMIMFITMIGVAGIAIDIARFEASRTEIQAHLDNATLAAASSRQRKTPPFKTSQQIIDSYMESQGLAGKYTSTVVHDGDQVGTAETTYRVETHATTAMNTIFMHMFGVNELDLSVVSAAEEGIPRLEVSLVLDISGSMDGSRMENLKSGASEFVRLMLGANTESNPNRVSISLVPYNMQVNAGEYLWNAAAMPSSHNYSHCAEWTGTSFNSTTFSIAGASHAMAGSYGNVSGNYYNYTYGSMERPECVREPYAKILPVSNNADAIIAQINSFVADGATSIDLGMKWGAALLDPSSQYAITSLASNWVIQTDDDGNEVLDPITNLPIRATDDDGEYISNHYQAVDPGFIGRPTAYDGEARKIIVVMTDGENTQQKYIKSSYRSPTGNSGVWYDPNRVGQDKFRFSSQGGSNWSQMKWPDMWAHIPTLPLERYDSHRRRYYSDNISGSTKNNRLSAVCSQARSNGVLIYSIAYSATPVGQAAMFDCAGSDYEYYKTANTNTIDDTFGEIFDSIQKLRLTY